MANVKDDEFETLDFADEGEWVDEDMDGDLVADVADMIADCFGRSVIDADRQLAAAIITKVRSES